MFRVGSLGLVALTFAAWASAETGTPVNAAPKTGAMLQAEANVALVRKRPLPKREPARSRPEAAALAGEYGTVVIRGIVTEDGRFVEPSIKSSSKSAQIDSAALAGLPETVFEPARDAEGRVLSVPINYSVEIPSVEFHGENSITNYGCAQFVRDNDWWRANWPDRKGDRIYSTFNGYVAVSALRGDFGKNAPSFEQDWNAAVDGCRRKPSAKMLDQLKFYGKFVRGMVKASQ